MAFNDLLMRTLNGEKTDRPPVWFMRQAGRYMKEYREVRSKVTFLELCKSPELCTEVTLQPIRAFGFDNAILFSDILIPVEPMGIKLDFDPAPVIANPVRTLADADKLREIDPAKDVPFVIETVKMLVKALDVPLIGFSGAPFTLACYMVEGKGSKNFEHIKIMMHTEPKAYAVLMEKLASSTLKYLQAQIDAGAHVVQMFDTWAGVLSPYDYEKFVFPYVKHIADNIKGAPLIYFAKDAYSFYDTIGKLNCAGMGVDWKTRLVDADAKLGSGKYVLQGNFDPVLLFGSKEAIKEQAEKILEEGRTLKGHIFNLGHGILPPTPVENVDYLVKIVKGLA
ncbi:uroporphyrinogen decarboxylase [Seleniivibrio woodruffii]|uniref:uroporphyrinogen decarboxylase n=1 Tax=Seleniivibrio woodruffii TaxID=1078050 RepID=UPI0026F1B359|nr:uroporphyrinogen decarboxylase [Seleniivibrio woodruffii]